LSLALRFVKKILVGTKGTVNDQSGFKQSPARSSVLFRSAQSSSTAVVLNETLLLGEGKRSVAWLLRSMKDDTLLSAPVLWIIMLFGRSFLLIGERQATSTPKRQQRRRKNCGMTAH